MSTIMLQAPQPRETSTSPQEMGRLGPAFGLVVIFVATAFLNRPGLGFEVADGVALLFPAAAVAVLGGLFFGWWGALACFAGFLVAPWGLSSTFARSLFFAAAASLQALIPALLARRRVAGIDRTVWVLMSCAVLNMLISAAVALPALVHWSQPRLDAHEAAAAFAAWFFGDLITAVLLAIPVVLLIRPQLLLTPDHLDLFRRWRKDVPSIVMALGGVLVVAVVLEIGGQVGFPNVHWIAAAFLVPILYAAVRGGIGAALLTNGVAGLAYIVEVVRIVQFQGDSGPFGELFSTYLNLVVFALGGVAVGLAWGRSDVLVRDLEKHRRLLQDNFERVVTALAAAVEAKDPTTDGHVQRVGRVSVAVGRRLGLTGDRLEMLRYGALLHDVGKIGVPEQILNKPGPLDDTEREILERHVTIGVEILESVDILQPAIPFIRYHQERWDGCTDGALVRYAGYFGLKGEETPLEARIIAVVDAWDAMTHDRPYRKSIGWDNAMRELREESGKQFDPMVIEALIDVATGRSEPHATVPVVEEGELVEVADAAYGVDEV